jgi:peptidoglycan/xylan/chitin deacetylase (PgdA/CDA1 family)
VTATNRASVFLMYHELQLAGRQMGQSDPGYTRYVLPVEEFEAQMLQIQDMGLAGVRVSDALTFSRPAVAITFDDGCETDLLSAAPVLYKLGFGATFYIVAGMVGKAGRLSSAQLCELQGLGFEIGCHSMTHPYLPDLDDGALEREVSGAKTVLEKILGSRVEHFSCPGGRYDSRALRVAKAAGFRTLATSVPRANTASTDPFSLGRVPITRSTSPNDFEKLCRGEGLWKMRLSGMLRSSAMRLLGNTAYDRARAVLLKKS